MLSLALPKKCALQSFPLYTVQNASHSPIRNEMYVRVNEVFNDYHSRLMNGGFTPESVVTFTGKLHSAMYADLGWLPWLHVENHIIAYMQILMNNQRNSLLRKTLYKHRHFEAIYNTIFRNLDEIPAEHCPSILLSLLHCGLDQSDPVVVVLLTKCYDFIPTADIPSLRKLTYIMQGLDSRNLLLAGKIVERLDKILKNNNFEDIDVAIDDICNTVPIIAAYMSSDLLKACVKVVLRKMNSSSDLGINTVGTYLRFVCKVSFRISKNLLQEIRLAATKALDECQDFDLLESHHIAEVCHNAKRLGCYSGDLVTKMQIRSLDLLRGKQRPLHIRHITNLLFAFTQNSSSDIKKEITELLIKNIDDADVLILSNLADCIMELELYDPELMALFHWKVIQNIDNIAQYITRLVKILRLLRKRQEFDAVFNQKIAEVLLKLLSSRQRFDSTFVIITACFVLPTVRTLIPNMLMECLSTILPRCNLSHTLLILSGLEKMKGPWLRSLHNQVLEIRANIQENILGKIESATQANQLAHLIKCLHIKSQKKDFMLLDQIMSYYPRLTKAMTHHDYLKTVQAFKYLSHPYYHPEVFEDLIQYMKKNIPEVGFTGVLDLVSVLANAGYRPQDFDSFADCTIQILTDAMKAENYLGQVFLAHYLSIMQIFPDNVLGQIFTFDFLEEIDRIIEAEPDRQLILKNIMMQLNRSVILECPHLDVPWFHQHYCEDQEEKSRIKIFQGSGLLLKRQRILCAKLLEDLTTSRRMSTVHTSTLSILKLYWMQMANQ
ncbi:FAST kinase domain-containing protein 1, mitochondrial-like isoform X2 [Pomacea canaliculata]|uniref:FAST kinase domain-containing protein 1, mitochondrial-like isoform X2 n=1 Tax=Pomacea canaliculata TaxID=400727 RepID=UPI000D726A66|nr:FAST kinase domain-containing protein 1, mitochondrial-like isoform X2 [Pomacea canaliculata]